MLNILRTEDGFPESWGTIPNPLNRLLTARYNEAYKERNLISDNINNSYAIFPQSYYKTVENMECPKLINFCFIGSRNANESQRRSRNWVAKFVEEHFDRNSHLQYTDEKEDYVPIDEYDYSCSRVGFIPRKQTDENCNLFDEGYYETMSKSMFCLCPAGDLPYSIRFYEAIMCKAIPIVNEKWETWRSEEESKLDYKYYLTSDAQFRYNEEWVQHNYELFIKHHTLERRSVRKCCSRGCKYIVHSDDKNNDGKYCCYWCSKTGEHGGLCERTIYSRNGNIKTVAVAPPLVSESNSTTVPSSSENVTIGSLVSGSLVPATVIPSMPGAVTPAVITPAFITNTGRRRANKRI